MLGEHATAAAVRHRLQASNPEPAARRKAAAAKADTVSFRVFFNPGTRISAPRRDFLTRCRFSYITHWRLSHCLQPNESCPPPDKKPSRAGSNSPSFPFLAPTASYHQQQLLKAVCLSCILLPSAPSSPPAYRLYSHIMAPVPTSVPTNGHAASNGHAANGASAPKLGFATRALHVGSEPNAETGAVIPPISLSTTFAQDGVGNHKGYEYARSGNPTRDSFERAVAALEGGERGFAFSSGSAVTGTILTSLPPNSHVISVNDVYGGTHRYFTKVASAAQHVKVDFVDLEGEAGAVTERIEKLAQPNTQLVWVETPTNPTLRLIDISTVVQAVRKVAPQASIVVDNTFLSPYYQQPLALGADVVVHSVTKYLNGHSDVVMGVAATSHPHWIERLSFLQNALGAIPSPFDSWLALRGLKTLSLRMRAHGENAVAIAQFALSHPAVEAVAYPGLPKHAGRAAALANIKSAAPAAAANAKLAAESGAAFPYGGMMGIRLRGSPSDQAPADAFLSHLHIFTLAESLGGVESLIEQPSKMTHGGLSDQERAQLGIGHNYLRLSPGVEDITDLLADIKRGLDAAQVVLEQPKA